MTISYFETMSDLEAWKRGARAPGGASPRSNGFYTEYEIDVAEIVRHYEWTSSD